MLTKDITKPKELTKLHLAKQSGKSEYRRDIAANPKNVVGKVKLTPININQK